MLFYSQWILSQNDFLIKGSLGWSHHILSRVLHISALCFWWLYDCDHHSLWPDLQGHGLDTYLNRFFMFAIEDIYYYSFLPDSFFFFNIGRGKIVLVIYFASHEILLKTSTSGNTAFTWFLITLCETTRIKC